MGINMPSCPGQEALQQSVDSLRTAQTEMKAKVSMNDAALKALKEEVAQLNTKLADVTTTVLAQKAALEEMTKAMKTAPAPTGRPAPGKRK